MNNIFKFKELELIKDKLIIFFDFGANVGLVTNVVSSLSIDKKIFAFEPVISNFKILENKFGNNKKIKLENKAVWTKKGKVNFSVGIKNTHTNSKITKIIGDRGYDKKKYVRSYEIDCVDAHQYINDLNLNKKDHFVVMKMDIEGAEYDVLDYMIEKNTIKAIDLILIEFHREPIPKKSRQLIKTIIKKNPSIRMYEEYTPGIFKKCEV